MSSLPAAAPGPPPMEAPRPLAAVHLIAVLALALCTLIAATAVSIGLARAAGLTCITGHAAPPEQVRSR